MSSESRAGTRKPLRILLVEDCDADAELLLAELDLQGYDVTVTRVQTGEAMREALAAGGWQVVISDYSLPSFSGPAALAILKETALDVPFIMVSGTVGEHTAVESLKAGACDFLVKGNLTRLAPALDREIREAERRRQQADVEQQLRRSQERSAYALAAAGAGVWEFDLASNVTSWSDVTARMFGVEFGPGEMPFDSFRNRIHPDDLAEFDAAVARSIVTDQPYRVEFRAVWPDGRHRWISSKGRVSRNHEGEPVAITGIALDVSERKDLEQQLLQSIKLEGIGRLAGGIAHDFNNLLTVIQGYAEMVLDQIGPDKPISGDLQEIRDASDRAAALTRQLLAFSRKQTLHIAAMDLNEIIVSLRNMLQRLIGEDIDIRLELTPDLPLIRADRAQVDQVLMNLVVNARDAMPDGGVITLATTAAVISREQARMMNHDRAAPGQYAQLRVTDSGTGMDAATRDRIFEPFFTTKGVGKGTGLGLSTVYGVLQQLGGNIEVASAPGHGTTFTLYFPKAPEGMASTVDVSKHAAALADRREVVLVVEDQRGVRQLVSRILSRHGYTVLEAADSDQALALAEHHSAQIDLVLTDVVMPVMSGPELVAVLRAARPLKVLYMSGYTGADLSRRAALAADDTVLEKPFTASVLLDAVREVLDQREARAH